MRYWLPIALLAGFWIVFVAILLAPEPEGSTGVPHPEYGMAIDRETGRPGKPAMDHGGDGLERHGEVFLLGWLLGSIVIAVLVGLLALGARQRRRDPAPAWVFLLGGLLMEGIFAALCWSYRQSLKSDAVAFFGPFPAATSWLVFGIWLSPLFFILFYVIFFPRWILDPRDLESFDRLVAEAGARRRRDAAEAEGE